MDEYRDASGRLAVHLAGNDRMLDVYRSRLEGHLAGKLVERLDGVDQAYWTIEVEGVNVVLHWDSIAGVSLHIEDRSRDEFLRCIAGRITDSSITNRLGEADVGDRPPSAG